MSKWEVYNLKTTLDVQTGEVVNAHCTCKAGNSAYCNHIMALLFELADYSLHELDKVPEEAACTRRARAWGIPGEKDFPKEPIMSTTVQKHLESRGIKPTLYDPRLQNQENTEGIRNVQKQLLDINPVISFAHVIRPDNTIQLVDTKFGFQAVGSPLSYQLSPVEFNFEVVVNLSSVESLLLSNSFSSVELTDLPSSLLNWTETFDQYNLNESQKSVIESLRVSLPDAVMLEKETVKQRSCKKWFELRQKHITASNVYRIFTRKRQHSNLAKDLAKPRTQNSMNKVVKKKLKHGVRYEPVARDKYKDIMKFKERRHVTCRETGIVINPSVFWLGASPDGLLYGCESTKPDGLLEIKCPEGK